MAKRSPLVVGEIYFTLFYHDEHLRLPQIETFVYVGENLGSVSDTAQPIHYFQSAESFERNGLWTLLPKEQRDAIESDDPLHLFGEDALDLVCDLEGLIVQLDELSSRLRGRPAA